MTRQETIARIISGGSRKARQPVQERGLCPCCGKRGLGNTYVGRRLSETVAKPYRDCRYCDEKVPV